MNRRRFLQASALAGGAAVAVLGVEAMFVEPARLTITTHRLRGGARGARAARGSAARIVQLTDLHLRSISGFHERLARAVAALHPDLIVITGDSIDRGASLPLLGEFLDLLDPSTPKLATWGNWEHYLDIGLPAIAAVYASHGCRLLNNESVAMYVNGAPLLVTGLDTAQDGRPDLALALRDVAPASNHLVLAHCPIQRDQVLAGLRQQPVPGLAQAAGPVPHAPSLVLAGHTHGGQITFGGWAPITPAGSGRYVAGWYRDAAIPLYVSRGIGETGVPMRLGCPPEIAVFDWELAT